MQEVKQPSAGRGSVHNHDDARTTDVANGRGPVGKPAAKGAAPPRGLRALQQSVGNAAVVQFLRQAGHAGERDEHQHGAGCGHPAERPPVQRSAVHDVLRGSGRPLDEAIRGDMESRLGADFSDVRIHNDSVAKASAAEIGARAYTSGSHIVIGDGGADKHTLAHELTHVIQQRQGPVAGTDNGSGLKVSDPSDRFEREAEANATRVMSGGSARHAAAPAVESGAGRPTAVQSASAGPAVQRAITVTLDGYASAKNVADMNALTRQQVGEYYRMVVVDDYKMAVGYAQDGGTRLKELAKALRTPAGNGAVELDALVTEIQSVIATDVPAELRANKNTRYAVEPQGGYAHQSLPGGKEGVWANDDEMWDEFGQGLGERATEAQETTGRIGNDPLKQLTWGMAKELLPRPLTNLIFDVRFQLESGTLLDERTPDQLTRRDATPNEPGTLRSWHQDDSGRLPATGADHAGGPGAFRGQVPAESQSLHDHYSAHSQSGTGSSVLNAAGFPRGFAEYTGTGSNSEHNTKVVLDYIQKRVYLTLTHYQYWGLVVANGRSYFVPSGTQDAAQADGNIRAGMQRQRIAAGTPYRLMSPWVQILA
ncbi:eCIS core domain-containing protein [Streptomyces xanthochromogenes]|uniref:eCIS core domain-containing protein n=1 Tax=Streptomyces xanthochromogenes TaxID=67384 RepID=UPI003F4D560B